VPLAAATDLHLAGVSPAETPRVTWKVTHSRCDNRPEFLDDYHIRPEEIRTRQQLACWSEYLRIKPWIRFTDWDALLSEAAGTIPSSRITVTGRAAA
jgi:hypothetical protein